MRRPQALQRPIDEPPPAAPPRPKRAKRTPELDAALGARIRAVRVAAHVSQTALGEAIGISFQQIQKYETGRDRVAATTLGLIAKTLGVHAGSFYNDDAEIPLRGVADIRAAMQIAECIQSIRSPAVRQKLLALAETLAGTSHGEEASEAPTSASDGTP